MITTTYNYQETLAASVKANWRVEDIIGGDKRLDFTKPFMPDSLARVESMQFLTGDEKILLNQIRGYGYLSTFIIVEEFILPFVLDHVRPHLNEDDYRTRALLQFASEEAKHIQLFREFAEEFNAGFVTNCETIGPAEEIGKAVLAHSPLGVALVILGILLLGFGNGGVVWAEQTVPSGLTAVLVAMSPFWMVGIDALTAHGGA